MSLPPGPLTQKLASTFPQFVLCDATLAATLKTQLDPLTNPAVADVVQWLQNNPAVASATGDVLTPPATPGTTVAPLDAGLVAALGPLLGSTATWIAGQAAFGDIAWQVQPGVVPGPQPVVPIGSGWSVTTLAPRAGLTFADVTYAGGSFTLSLANALPRHLAVYAEFTRGGVAVMPAGWVSQLPAGVPVGFESSTLKYLGMLLPGAAVAAIPVDTAAQKIALTLPANADAVTLHFGGVGSSFAPLPDAAGVIATFVLDIVVPWVAQNSGAAPTDLACWYRTLLADRAILANVITSGAFLLRATDLPSMLAALSDELCGAMLGTPLTALRKSIAKELGAPAGKSWSWVDQLAPAAGWPAQLLGAFLDAGQPQYWPATMSGAITLDLSPRTSVALALTLVPDATSGIWPPAAASYTAEISYDAGFSQQLTGAMPAPQDVTPIDLVFGSVATGGPIALSVALHDGAGLVVSTATAEIAVSPAAGTRTVNATVALHDVPPVICATTRYRLASRLTCTTGTYAWDAAATRSTAIAPVSPLTALAGLSFQQDALCLGYAWSAQNQNITVCGGTTPLQNAYFIQNIGSAVPASEDRRIDCGLVQPPLPAYTDGAAGCYLDTRSPKAMLRPVAFGRGAFDQQGTRAVAGFTGTPIAVCLGTGHAAAIGPGDMLQIACLADAPVADALAPVASRFGGSGSRIGLLSQPVAVAATPGGLFLVLEQGNARVQAFDAYGNPTAVFADQPCFALTAGARYNDIAVSPAGLIYLAGSAADGSFFLDVHTPDGALLNRTSGVNAAKIAVDAQGTVFTLDFDTLTGPTGRIEPMLSRWTPHG